MATLYELTVELETLLYLAEDPDTDPEVIRDTMEGVEGEFEIKAEGYAKVIAQLSMEADGLKAEIERLSARKTTMENNAKRMKKILEEAMIRTGNRKFKTPLFSFRIQKNTPSVVLDTDQIPEKYLIPQDPKIDKVAIKKALNDGDEDAAKIAHLESTESIRIS